jgi:hypothetical protein
VDERLARDVQGEPFIDMTAERDVSEREEPAFGCRSTSSRTRRRAKEQREAVKALLARTEELLRPALSLC